MDTRTRSLLSEVAVEPQGVLEPLALNGPVQADWRELVDRFWASAPGEGLHHRLLQRHAQGAVIYPPQPLRALALTALADVRVVIVGQDPYHGPGQAEGLAFSVPSGQGIPPSLRNIHKELIRSMGPSAFATATTVASGSLVPWAEQGVLLLNTSLTVEQGCAASHAKWGWEALTQAILAACAHSSHPLVFMLWGGHAQKQLVAHDLSRHLVLTANHPSPLSALRGPQPFIGCDHFVRCNDWLKEKQQKTIDWLR